MLQQLNTTEQRVTERFTNELEAKAEQLQKETTNTASLNNLVNRLKDTESAVKKELERFKKDHRLLSVKYNNQASEHAAAFTVDPRTAIICTMMLTISTEDERANQTDRGPHHRC
jgi:translation initiation factor 2B subunit (eIF-2B alpha/beta/delta family)